MSGLNKEGWVMVYNSIDGTDITILESKLNELGIEATTFNHQDSMLTSLNDTNYTQSLYVHEKDLARAKEIIENR